MRRVIKGTKKFIQTLMGISPGVCPDCQLEYKLYASGWKCIRCPWPVEYDYSQRPYKPGMTDWEEVNRQWREES